MDIQLRDVSLRDRFFTSRKGGTGVLVHPMDETSKFVSGLSCRNALVVPGGHFSPLWNRHRKPTSGLVGPPFRTFLRVMTESSIVRWSRLSLKSA